MSNKLKDGFENLYKSFKKFNTTKKAILVTILAALLGMLFYSISFSTDKEYVYLFNKPLSSTDYGLITAELQQQGELFETIGDQYILVQDEQSGARIRMTLAQNQLLPNDIKGWELFDMESWTTTEFDRNVKLRRAVEGEMKRHLQSLIWVDSAEVTISIPKETLYSDRSEDVSAAVTIQPAEGFHDYLKNKKIIQGIENIIARGIDGINPNNIVITDFNGNQLNLFSDDDYENNIKQAMEESRVREREIKKIKEKIESALRGVLATDRYRVAVDVELNFNRKSIDQKKILPVVIKERTPGLPYDDSIVKENVKVSEKQTSENFEGLGFIPEGPPGQEPNIPPGYKESLDGKNKYTKEENINNYLNGEQVLKQVDDAMEIEKKSVSVTVDGIWEYERDDTGNVIFENNQVKRRYIPVNPEDISKMEELIKASINFDISRGDKVVVENIAFDRAQEFKAEDDDFIFYQDLRNYSLYLAILILLVVLVVYILRYITVLVRQRREEREKELEQLRSIQREQILSDIESLESDTSIFRDAKTMNRLHDEIIELVKQDSKNAAQVIKFWIAKGSEA